MDLRCCVNFCYTVKWLSFTYTFFFVFFSTVVYHRVLNRQYPVLYRRTLLFSHPIYNSSNLLIPNSQFFLPHPLPLWQRPVCSLCLWICFCFVNMFICVIFYVDIHDDIIWHLSFSFWLTLLSMKISRSMLLPVALLHSFYGWVVFCCVCVACVYHIFFIHSSVHGHLGCFHILANISSVSMNIMVHVSFWIIVLSGCMPPGIGNGNPLQYSCLENSMDRRTCLAAVHQVIRSWTQLSDWTLGMPKNETQSVLLTSFLVIFIHVQVWEPQEYGHGKSDSLYEKKKQTEMNLMKSTTTWKIEFWVKDLNVSRRLWS